jgi:hypothetical protein
MLRRHFIENSEDSSTLINGGLPKDIPDNTIYYWTTESVEKINEGLSYQFHCYDSNNTELELVSNIITDNVGIITMSGSIRSFQFIFYGGSNDILDVRYVQLPKSCLGGVVLSYYSNLQELYIDYQITEVNAVLIFPYILYTPNLHTIKVDKYNPRYDSRNNCNAIIETSTNTLIQGCKNSFIPDSVTKIGEYAFYGCRSLTSIEIPNSVRRIDNFAFYYCSKLGSITCYSLTAPIIDINTFFGLPLGGTLKVPTGSYYGEWLRELPNWQIQYI